MDNNFSVYIHHNLINHKVYVGKTRQRPERRWGGNGCGYKKNPRFYAAIQELGWDSFEHIIVARNISEESAKQIEKDLIKLYHANEEDHGYNMTNDGRYNDPEFQKEYFRNWEHTKRDKKKRLEAQRKRYPKNKDKLNARRRERRANDPEYAAHQKQKQHESWERRKAEKNAERREKYAAMLAAMTPEELAAYRAKEKERLDKYRR